MKRTIPLHIYIVTSVLLIYGMVMFGWYVKVALTKPERLTLGLEIALAIASLPDTAFQVLHKLTSQLTGNYRDEGLRTPRPKDADYSDFEPISATEGINLQGVLINADQSKITIGWRLLVGSFVLDGRLSHSAMLLSPDLSVVKAWLLDEPVLNNFTPHSDNRKFPHGVEVLDDASLIYAFDNGITLQRKDLCGNRIWAIAGDYHHAVSRNESGTHVWTLIQDGVAKIDTHNGETVQYFTLDEINDANPEIDILELRQLHQNDLNANSRNTTGRWLDDHYHVNDVDPLHEALASKFPDFEAGDLLISARSLNLVFVVSPETLRIKWWRIGASQRQHDPDWLKSGKIMIFNNRMSRDYSTIMTIDPGTFATRTVVDGREHDIYSRIRGKSQMLPNGTIAVTSSQQGRVFEVDRNGETVLEIVNTKPGSPDTNYVISELKWLTEDSFNLGDEICAKTN